jgi:Lantibiotic dehydratase, N terminus
VTNIALPSGRWALWPDVAVRSAGFEAAGALRLNAPGLARQADALIERGRDKAGWKEFRRAFADASVAWEEEIRAIAASPRFRCALTWQNHHAFRRVVLPLLDRQPGSAARSSRERHDEEFIASYWQRYCLKNDTIGFFGPVGWGTLAADSPTSIEPSGSLVAKREIFFETWAVDRLADALAQEPGMREWLPARRMPYLRVEGQTVLLPGRSGKAVSPAVAEVLRRCDGTRPVRDVAEDLQAEGWVGKPEDVLSMLTELVSRRWISWPVELPAVPHPEAHLRRRLAAIRPPELRERALTRLATLTSHRDEVDAAGEDPDKLMTALDGLDESFAVLTQSAPTRNAGRAYGGRTLVYHDARRDLSLRLGTEIVTALAPLELVLDSARWLTHQADAIIRAEIAAIYRRLAARSGQVTLSALWFECMPVIHGTAREAIAGLVGELRRGWHDILAASVRASRVRYRASSLQGPVRKRFYAPHPGWLGARYLSPDVMLVASGSDAIARGDFELVLGELHLSMVSYRHHCLAGQHPDQGRLFQYLDADCPRPRLLPALPKDNPPRLTIRTHPALIRDSDRLVELFYQTADPFRPGVLAGSDIFVADDNGRLLARAADGARFDVMEPFSEMLADAVIDAFSMFEEAEHMPRITIDRLVVQRETWRFLDTELSFSLEKDEARRFVGARSWQRRHALPQRVFVKSAYEQKPFFVDFDSPVYVALLAKAVRQARERGGGQLMVSEMLPDAERLWLADRDGRRYTCELRLAAVDLRENPAWANLGATDATGAEIPPRAASTPVTVIT